MNISFQCDVCFKTLRANAIAAGRVITCPYCRQTTTIPRPGQNEEQDSKPQTPTAKNDAGVDSSTTLDSTTSSDFSDWRDPTIDSDWEQMLQKFPNFRPNPFGFSFPLDKAIREAASDAELDDGAQDFDKQNGSTSNQYSVDDLIKGVE